MKLWLLRPIEDLKDSPWEPWYDKAMGFVVRAETEAEARAFAQAKAGDEKVRWDYATRILGGIPAWTDPNLSTCVELPPDGEAGVILRDFASA